MSSAALMSHLLCLFGHCFSLDLSFLLELAFHCLTDVFFVLFAFYTVLKSSCLFFVNFSLRQFCSNFALMSHCKNVRSTA